MAKPRHDEKQLAIFAVAQVRRFGGVLEHPAASTLWIEASLPRPGAFDEFGGWTMPIHQSWFGHRAEKKTLIYIVGCVPAQLPDYGLDLGYPTHTISSSGRRGDGSRLKARPECTKAEREHTPLNLAVWLVDIARRCYV